MYESLASGHRNELLSGNLGSNRGSRVIIWRKVDEDGLVIREISCQSRIFVDPEFVLKVTDDGPIRLVHEDEMTAQILVFLFVGRTDPRWGGIDLAVNMMGDFLTVPLLGELADILCEDVIEGFEILESDGAPWRWNGYREGGI